MGSVSSLLGYLAPLLMLWLTLVFWRHYDANGIDLRRDRKNLKRRGDFRARLRWPVSVETAIGSIKGRTRNVSPRGATLVSLQPLICGEIVRLTLGAPGRVMRLRGEVMWIETFLSVVNGTPRKAIGVLFRELSEDERNFLADSVEAWRQAEERKQGEAPSTSFFAKRRGRRLACSTPPIRVRGSFRIEGAFHRLRPKMEGILCQSLALFRPHHASKVRCSDER